LSTPNFTPNGISITNARESFHKTAFFDVIWEFNENLAYFVTISQFALQPFKPSSGFFALRKLVANR
jgi:hypothetical protein